MIGEDVHIINELTVIYKDNKKPMNIYHPLAIK